MIGDTTNNKRCKIIDARKCSSCHCDYYVRYSEDGGSTWLGLSFGGEPGLGGTGCPGYGMTSATQEQALAWLRDEHIAKGRCGCESYTDTTTTTGTSSTASTSSEVTTNPAFQPTPGKCLSKDISPVEVDDSWQDSCKDEEGNLFFEGESLLSCCGCFKYVCSETGTKDAPRYNWAKEV